MLWSKLMLQSSWLAHFPQTQLVFSYRRVFLPVVPVSWKFSFSLWTSHFLGNFYWHEQVVSCALSCLLNCICSSIPVFLICCRWFYTKTFVASRSWDGSWDTPYSRDNSLATRSALVLYSVKQRFLLFFFLFIFPPCRRQIAFSNFQFLH